MGLRYPITIEHIGLTRIRYSLQIVSIVTLKEFNLIDIRSSQTKQNQRYLTESKVMFKQ